VLTALKSAPSSIPALLEYDYVGLGTSIDEVKQSLAYLKQTL
jgi:hypothetical protein